MLASSTQIILFFEMPKFSKKIKKAYFEEK
jgi:hypothetical protein